MTKISIHKALSELKLIDNKVTKNIDNFNVIGLMQKNKKVNNLVTESEFESNAKATKQAIDALIERKQKIKDAIILSNAVTKVKIGGKRDDCCRSN